MKRTDEQKINSLHGDLKKKMFETGLQVQIVDDGCRDQMKDFMEGLKGLVGYSAWVIIEEEKIFFPGIISIAPFMIPLLEQEHRKLEELGERICILADDYDEAYTAGEKKSTLMQIRTAYNEWMALTLQHLGREEMIINQVIAEEIVEVRVLSLVAA